MAVEATTRSVPARAALNAAIEWNERLGHENRGFLSETHGFMPREHPLPHLPASHAAWDETAAQLPAMFRSLTLRAVLDRMPVLDAGAEDLDDRYLLRASAIFGIFAHAYHYAEPNPPAGHPDSILQPWREVSARLGQPAPHLSFNDLNLYNWQVIDRKLPDPIRVENLRLLIPILGNEDERRFQMTPVEMVAAFTPIVGAVVRAQEAVVNDDPAALARELMLIADVLDQLTFESFAKVDPNPYSPTYVNPTVWGKTVAPLATPFQAVDPPPGPSGTAIPAFQLLDGFLGRRGYDSSVGSETARMRNWFPPHWRDFLDAVETISVPDYVAGRGDRALHGVFQDALEAYAGNGGLLGRHRLKTFGFLDLSFKAGRSQTLGGFGGGYEDRLWDRMDGELELSKAERYTTSTESCHFARVMQVAPAGTANAPSAGSVVLDVAGTGIRYHPGDRCAVLPENDPDLVDRTLRGLRARGDEPVQLTARWRAAVNMRDTYQGAKVLSLRTLLTFGRIRPLSRPVAKALYRLSHNAQLRVIIEARTEDQWELWQVLELLADAGFRPTRLWKAPAGERDSICAIVPPESFRMFSIASAMDYQRPPHAEELHLLVGELRYDTTPTTVSPGSAQRGTATSFLLRSGDRAPEKRRRVSIKVIHPPHFGLPRDPNCPVVMFAGGTGVSPFLGMLAARAGQTEAGENWLFFGTRTRAELYGEAELGRLVDEGHLNLRVAFSRDDASVADTTDGSRLVVEPGRRQRIDDLILDDGNAERLWELLRCPEDGGLGASFYLCGRTGFAGSVTEALLSVIRRHIGGMPEDRDTRARQFLFRLIGEGRYRQEIFTTYAGAHTEQPQRYFASEVVCRNNDVDGYWMIVDGRVYDLTQFAQVHPGGPKIIRSYAGMDATDAYRKAQHHVNPEVDAMLGLYEIGAVRRLDLGSGWGVAASPNGLRMVSLKDIYRAWIGLLYTVVEVENALANDYAARHEPVTHDETSDHVQLSPYKVRLLLQTHNRFVHEYMRTLTGERLAHLWTLTGGPANERHDLQWMRRTINAVHDGPEARAAAELDRHVTQRLGDLTRLDGPADPDGLHWCAERAASLEAEDRRFLRQFKLGVRAGVQLFERWERDTISRGGRDLVDAAAALTRVVQDYHARRAGPRSRG